MQIATTELTPQCVEITWKTNIAGSRKKIRDVDLLTLAISTNVHFVLIQWHLHVAIEPADLMQRQWNALRMPENIVRQKGLAIRFASAPSRQYPPLLIVLLIRRQREVLVMMRAASHMRIPR
jgi:hypothetical protein